MTDQEKQEQKNRRIGLLTSIGVHAALLLLFLFAMAWRAPDPPLPEFGIIVNVGFDDEGSGDVQTDKPASDPTTQEEEQVIEEPVETPPVEEKPVDKVETQEVITSKIESPVVVEKKEETVKEKPKDEPKKEAEKVKTEYKPTDAKSEGDDVNKTGNKGQPEGTLDPNGQYTGKPGGGGGGNGTSLSMSGWAWAEQPNTSGIPDNESGRIVFKIECDENGDIIKIETSERGVSPKTEQILRAAIERTSLVRDAKAGPAPLSSSGTVTFVIKSR
jgi:outer membrane biosynthesis protein TonB